MEVNKASKPVEVTHGIIKGGEDEGTSGCEVAKQ